MFELFQIGYMVFLVLFCYVILDRVKITPNWPEIYIMAFMLTMGLEKIRQVGFTSLSDWYVCNGVNVPVIPQHYLYKPKLSSYIISFKYISFKIVHMIYIDSLKSEEIYILFYFFHLKLVHQHAAQ